MMAFARASCRESRAISRFNCLSRRFCAVAGLTFGSRRIAPSDTSSVERAACANRSASRSKSVPCETMRRARRAYCTDVIAQDLAFVGSRNQASALDGSNLMVGRLGGRSIRCLSSMDR
jgi:hypothetical protein